ncbi:MAG: hypothetical protein AAF378_08440 [Cyanobacteria bacterium P01_A01_bin.84]
MNMFINFLRSLLLAMIFSFIAPMFFLGGLWVLASLIGHIPVMTRISELAIDRIIEFLIIFGSGTPLKGIFVIGLTCSFVGALFDTYAFYRYQILRLNS